MPATTPESALIAEWRNRGALTTREVASIIRQSESKVKAYIRDGSLASFKLGRSRRIRPSAIESFLEEQEAKLLP